MPEPNQAAPITEKGTDGEERYQSEFAKGINDLIRQIFPWAEGVIVTGDKNNGSLSIPYNSPEQLDELVKWKMETGVKLFFEPEEERL